MLPSVLLDVTQSDPLLVNSQLLSPQFDELEKGSAQLTASCDEALGEVADPPLEVAVACAEENTQAEDGSLGREEEATFSGLESLDDILFQPTATTVGGGSKFRPKPTSRLKKKSAIANPSSLPKAVDSVSLQILSPQIEGLEKGSASIKATFTHNASTEVFSTGLHDSAPTDVYPKFLATQEAADPNDASHSGEVFGANVVFQNVHENNSLGKEVPVTFPDMESVDDVHFQPDTFAGLTVDDFQPKPIDQLESKGNVGPVFVHPKVMQSVSPQIEGSEESIHSTLLDVAVVEPSTSISCSFSQTDFSSQLPFSQEHADLVDTPCSKAAGFRDFQTDTGSSRNEATVASCGLEALDGVLFQPATATVRGVGKFRPKPKGRTTNTEPQANINPPDDMKPVSAPRNAQIHPSQTECLEVVSLDAFVDSSTVDSTRTFSLHGSQEPANHYVVPNLEAFFPGGDMELENVPETLETEVTGASSGLDALNDVLFQPATATVMREGKIRPRSKGQTANTEPQTSMIPSDDMEPVSAPTNAPILSPETECLEEVSPDAFVDAAAIDSTHTSSQHGSQEPADCAEVPNLEALIPGRDTDLQNAPETSGTEKTIIRKRKASTISNVSGGKSWSRKVNETAQDETPYSAMEENEISPTRQLRRRTTFPEPAGELQDGNHQISNNSAMNDHDADDDYRGEDKPKKKRASRVAKKSSAEKTEAGTPRQQRKRTTHSPVDECEDGNYEVSNDSAMDDLDDNDEYNGEDKSKKKKASRTAKKSVAETDKPVRGHKKASENADPANEEPPQKKFSHSTRRSRRRVNKVLLETPEEDIDPRKLVMKDLIILAEIKERQLHKAAAAAKKSFPTQSANGSFPTDAPYEDDDPLASTQGPDHDDDQANHRAEPSIKLNYHSFMKRTPKERWSKSDTETFYEAIRQFGTDFAMIQQLFPGRTRHQVKLKYKAEERKHPLQISDALIHRSKDHSHFERVLEQLEAQEQQNSNRDAESPDATARNEEEAALDSEWKGEEMREDSKYGVQSPVKTNESQDAFDWSQYGSANAFSLQEMEKGEHNLF